MIDFDLTEEQRLLEQSVREWAGREVAPKIRELDREHRFDKNILPQMAALGLLGCAVPAEYGGAGMDYISLGIVSEELEYVDTSLRVIISVHAGLNCLTLLTWGTEDQKQRYLVPQAQGQKIATYGLTEPAAGSDVRGIQTVAVKKGDRYAVTGEKMWISLADVADNFLVFAWTDLEKKKQRDPSGISAFMIERTSVLLARTTENSRSFHTQVNCSRKVAVIGPQQFGRTIRRNTVSSRAPSMRAASSI